jgi:hypothetical protein
MIGVEMGDENRTDGAERYANLSKPDRAASSDIKDHIEPARLHEC